MSGINVIVLQSNTILQSIVDKHPGSFSARTGVVIIMTIQSLSAMASFYFVRTFGRRPLLIWGYALISVTHIVIGVLTILAVDIGVLVFLCLFVFLYQVTTGQVAWIYAAETCCDISLGVSMYTLWFTVITLSSF